MAKKVLLVDPNQTVEIEMPDIVFEMWRAATATKLIKWKIIKTESGLKGMNINAVIIDELAKKNDR